MKIEKIQGYQPSPKSLNQYLLSNSKMMIFEFDKEVYSLSLSKKANKKGSYLTSKKLTRTNIKKIIYNLITKESDLQFEIKQKNFTLIEELPLITKRKSLRDNIINSLFEEESFVKLSQVMKSNVKIQKQMNLHFYKDGYLLLDTNEIFLFSFDLEKEKLFFILEKIPTPLPSTQKVSKKIRKLMSAIFANNEFELENFERSLVIILMGKSVETKAFFVLKGLPNTGKSLILKMVSLMFPSLETWSTSPSKLGHRFENFNFIGKKLLMVNDCEETFSKVSIEKIKKITGGDQIELEEKFIQSTDSKIFKGSLVVTTNYDIFPHGHRSGIPQRKNVINFVNEIDPNLIFKNDENLKPSTRLIPETGESEDSYIKMEDIIQYKHDVLARFSVESSISFIRNRIKNNIKESQASSFEPIEAFVKKFIEPVPKESCLIGKKELKRSLNLDKSSLVKLSKEEGLLFQGYLLFMETLNEEIKSKTVSSFKNELNNYFRSDPDFERVHITRTAGYNFKLKNARLLLNDDFLKLFNFK